MCEHLLYESVYLKELHKEKEYYIQGGGSCSVNYYWFIIIIIIIAINRPCTILVILHFV